MTRKEARQAGLSTYQGKPCKRGHGGLRFTVNWACVECSAAAFAAYRAKNKEKLAAYRAKNREARAAYCATWYTKNRESELAKRAEERVANREKFLATEARYRAANREKLLAKGAAYKKANPGVVNANMAKRKAIKLQATPAWADQAKINAIYVEAARLKHPTDHIIPLISPDVCGLHNHHNLMIMPAKLNTWKSNKLLADAIWTLVPTGNGMWMCEAITQ